MRRWSSFVADSVPMGADPVAFREQIDKGKPDADLLRSVIASVRAIQGAVSGKDRIIATSLLEMLKEFQAVSEEGTGEDAKGWRKENADEAWKLLKHCICASGQHKCLEGEDLYEAFLVEFDGMLKPIKERK